MNERARDLGHSRTHFENRRGTPTDGHSSSARDLAEPGRRAMRHTSFRDIVDLKTAVIRYPPDGDVPVENRNRPLNCPWEDGIKTGATRASGKALVGSDQPDSVPLMSAGAEPALQTLPCAEPASESSASLEDPDPKERRRHGGSTLAPEKGRGPGGSGASYKGFRANPCRGELRLPAKGATITMPGVCCVCMKRREPARSPGCRRIRTAPGRRRARPPRGRRARARPRR
jgi:hypothetical protein